MVIQPRRFTYGAILDWGMYLTLDCCLNSDVFIE